MPFYCFLLALNFSYFSFIVFHLLQLKSFKWEKVNFSWRKIINFPLQTCYILRKIHFLSLYFFSFLPIVFHSLFARWCFDDHNILHSFSLFLPWFTYHFFPSCTFCHPPASFFNVSYLFVFFLFSADGWFQVKICEKLLGSEEGDDYDDEQSWRRWGINE